MFKEEPGETAARVDRGSTADGLIEADGATPGTVVGAARVARAVPEAMAERCRLTFGRWRIRWCLETRY